MTASGKIIALLGLCFISSVFSAVTKEENIYELRTYVSHEGKINDLLARFENHTLALFESHGMSNIGYWLSEKEPGTLIYIIAHKNKQAAKENWQAFVADPKWQVVYQASREHGPLVKSLESVFLTPTAFSLLK